MKVISAWLVTAFAATASSAALAQFDPLSIAGSVVTVAMDVRTRTEVKNDVDIATSANKRLLDDEQAEWKGVRNRLRIVAKKK